MKFMHFQYLVSCLLSISACSPTYSFNTEAQMEHYLARKIPVETPIAQAKQIVKTEGFKIHPVIQKKLISEGNKSKDYATYIHVNRDDGFIFVREWHVEIYFENERVTKIHVHKFNPAP